MDDGKRENNKIKRSKSENVKTVVAVYLHRRQFPSVKPKKTSKSFAIKRALLDNRIGRPNSILYSCYSSDPLVIEYSFMFQKFMYWLKDQTKYKHQCYDIEKLVGPLFCHLYLDIRGSGQSEKASAFFKSHIDKVDKSKCDDMVKDILKAITSDSDVAPFKDKLKLSPEESDFEELITKFRSSKVVTEINSESLMLLKNFVSESAHIVFLQALQTWFDLKISCDKEELRLAKPMQLKHEPREQKHIKLQSIIKAVKKLPPTLYSVQITNSKNFVPCGIFKRQAGLVAFAERNILRIMPIHALDSLLGLHENFAQVRFTSHSKQIYCIALSPKNDVLCTGSADHSVCLYNLKKFKLSSRLLGHLGPVYCVAISENSKYIASGSQDGTARLWSLQTGKILRIFAGHTEPITCIQFHPNTMYVATGSADKNVRVWCLKSATPVRLLHAAKKEIYAIAFDPNGQYLACASDDKKVRIWDLSSSKIVYEFRSRDSLVTHLVWSKNGKHLCGGTMSGVVKIWDVTHHSKDHKHSDSVVARQINGRILSLEYTMGTFGFLSV